MKKYVFLLFLASSQLFFSQEKVVQKRSMLMHELEVLTYGLDDIVVENSENNQLEVTLFDENPHTHNILFNEEEGVLKVSFELNIYPLQDEVFRKYITRRLERARALIKVPKNKRITIHGKTIGVTSKSYEGDLDVYIERGNIKLNTILGNTKAHLFQGNVFADVFKTDLDLTTTKGVILVNDEKEVVPFQMQYPSSSRTFTVNSIHANITVKRMD
ncbi:hypothetical protein [Tenacibaculum aestuarii]|uniref:hypothetical protein n=1 Tax=Tenacibaculum aestuarii TaxID=362781 RepID=UPI00389436B5